MTEHMTDQPPAGGHRAGEGRRGSLRRPLGGRYVGGVAAGISRWFGLDPLLVRVAFVVLSLFGGSGFLLYALAWAIVPEDGANDGPLRVWLDRGPRPYGLLRLAAYLTLAAVGIATLLFGYDVIFSRSYSGLDLPLLGIRWLLSHGLQVGFLVAVTLIALSVLSRDRVDSPRGPARTSSGGAFAGPPQPAQGFQAGAQHTETQQFETQRLETQQFETQRFGAQPFDPQSGGDAALVHELRRRRLLPSRRRSPLGWLVLGLALAVTALLSALHAGGQINLSGLQIAGVALLILAAGLVTGAFAGWARWLAVVAAVLSLTLLPTTLSRQASATTYTDRPGEQFTQSGVWTIERKSGTQIVDLRSLVHPHIPFVEPALDADGNAIVDDNGELIKGKTITRFQDSGFVSISVNAGKAIVTVPTTGRWRVFAHTQFGTVTMPGSPPTHGIGAQGNLGSDDSPCCGGPVPIRETDDGIQIQVYVRYGDIEVRRATS